MGNCALIVGKLILALDTRYIAWRDLNAREGWQQKYSQAVGQ